MEMYLKIILLILFSLWIVKEFYYRRKINLIEAEIIEHSKEVFNRTFQINDPTILDEDDLNNLENTFPFKEVKSFIDRNSAEVIDITFAPLFEFQNQYPIDSLKQVPDEVIKQAFKYFIVGSEHAKHRHVILDQYIDEIAKLIRKKISFEKNANPNIQFAQLDKNNGIKPFWIINQISKIKDYLFRWYLLNKYQLKYVDDIKQYSIPLLYRIIGPNNPAILIFVGTEANLLTLSKLMKYVPATHNIYCMMQPILRCNFDCEHDIKMNFVNYINECLDILTKKFNVNQIDHVIGWSFGTLCVNLFLRLANKNHKHLAIKKISLIQPFSSAFSYSVAYTSSIKSFIGSYRLLTHFTIAKTLKQKCISLYINFMLHNIRVRWFCLLYVYYRYTLFDLSILNYPHVSLIVRTNDFLNPIEKKYEFNFIFSQLKNASFLFEPGEHGINLVDSFKKITFE